MFCSRCGSVVADGTLFCAACGQPVAGVPGAPASTAPVVSQPVIATARKPVAYAGFWLRFVAIIIDSIVVGAAARILLFPFFAALGLRMAFFHRWPMAPMEPGELVALLGAIFWLIAIMSVVKWLYFSLLESSAWQATLGKKALGLEVTDLEGFRISFARASGRFFGKIISALILWIGFIMAGFTEKKQALHDMMAGTLVIRKT
ncbi:MAG: RDD family protein [Candidatus Acidiferrales bacterium]